MKLKNCTFKLLEQKHINSIVKAFALIAWKGKDTKLYEGYLEEQKKGGRYVWVAFYVETFLGYVSLQLKSRYLSFANLGIPEIKDLNVLPRYRRHGIGSKLMELAENKAKDSSDRVGLGVGLYSDYGAAQKMYIARAYIPDGNGVTYNYQVIEPGASVQLDDDLNLWMIKKL